MNVIENFNSTLELPYNLIDIATGDEHFIFRFQKFDDNQTDYSIRTGGVTGSFVVAYKCRGIESCFECDITVGNVYDFYVSLSNAYETMFDGSTVTVLKNYGDAVNRTRLSIELDSKGHCYIVGCFSNKFSQYRSGINLSFEIDQSYIPEMLGSMKLFFDALTKIQGHGQFF